MTIVWEQFYDTLVWSVNTFQDRTGQTVEESYVAAGNAGEAATEVLKQQVAGNPDFAKPEDNYDDIFETAQVGNSTFYLADDTEGRKTVILEEGEEEAAILHHEGTAFKRANIQSENMGRLYMAVKAGVQPSLATAGQAEASYGPSGYAKSQNQAARNAGWVLEETDNEGDIWGDGYTIDEITIMNQEIASEKDDAWVGGLKNADRDGRKMKRIDNF